MWTKPRIDELLSRAKKGSQDAINDLLAICCTPLRRLIESRLDNKIQRRVDANDVLQETLIDINRRLPEYLKTQAMPFQMWVRQIARDRLIDAHRRHRTSARRSIDREHVAEETGSSGDRKRHDPCDSLETYDDPQDDDTSRVLNQAIARLSEQDCEIIVMRNFERLSNKDIARAMGLTEPAVSMRYTRATRRLRQMATMLATA